MDRFRISAARSDAHNIFDAVKMKKLIGIYTDGWHAHPRTHDRYRPSVICARISQHAAHGVDLTDILQESIGDKLGPQRIARHQHRFGEIPSFA
jgi:hypothetical protein